jgi:hypothetical protein
MYVYSPVLGPTLGHPEISPLLTDEWEKRSGLVQAPCCVEPIQEHQGFWLPTFVIRTGYNTNIRLSFLFLISPLENCIRFGLFGWTLLFRFFLKGHFGTLRAELVARK